MTEAWAVQFFNLDDFRNSYKGIIIEDLCNPFPKFLFKKLKHEFMRISNISACLETDHQVFLHGVHRLPSFKMTILICFKISCTLQ